MIMGIAIINNFFAINNLTPFQREIRRWRQKNAAIGERNKHASIIRRSYHPKTKKEG
jgi:hypothetical protein